MKKILCTIIGITLFTGSLKAQEGSGGAEQGFRFGMAGSPMITWLKSDEKGIDNTGIRFGFNYGLMLDYDIAQNYSLSFGLFITHKGGRIRSDDTLATFESFPDEKFKRPQLTFTTLQYLELPIGLKLKTNEIGFMTYFGQFGIAPGFNLQTKVNIDTETNKAKNDELLYDDMRKFNLGLHIGAGFEYNLGGNTSFLLALMFNNGFTNVVRFDERKIIVNNLGLRAGVIF